MNYADLAVVIVAVLIVSGGIFYNIRRRIKAKKEGTTGCAGCTGCSSKDKACKN